MTQSAVDRQKAAAAGRAVEFVRSGMVVGLGTGSTAAHAVRALGERVRAGLDVRSIPTSRATEALAREVGVPLTSFDETTRLDVTIDGADEVDGNLALVKGGGGALLREKIVAAATDHLVIVVDAAKRVRTLGAFPLPVEVIPFGWRVVAERVQSMGGAPALRRGRDGEPFRTDEGHWILDCAFGRIPEPAVLSRDLHEVPGVVEHGLFIDLARTVCVGTDEGVEVVRWRA